MKKTYEAQFLQTAPDKLEMKKGGGCIGCFGAPFFLAGLFIMLMSLQIIPVSNAKDIPWWSWILMLFMGLVFTAVGAGLIFGRNWISINKTNRRIWIAWGLLKPMRGTEYQLDNYKTVALNFKAGDSDTADSYPVVLKTDNATAELEMSSSGTYGTSLTQAMLLSSFLHLPLEDNSTDHSSTLMPESIAASQKPVLQEKAPEISSQPEIMRTKIIEDGNSLKIRLPGPAFSAINLIGLVFPVFVILLFVIPLLSFFQNTHTPPYVQYFFIGFIGLFFILLPILQTIKTFFLSRSFTTVVSVNAQGITIEHITLTQNKTQNIPVEEILGIDYSTRESSVSAGWKSSETNNNRYMKSGGVSAPGGAYPRWMSILERFSRSKGIIIKSKQNLYSFGAGLPDEEVYYLYTLVRSYLDKK